MQALRLSRQQQVRRRIGNQLRQLIEVCSASFDVAAFETSFRKQQVRLADCLAIANLFGKFLGFLCRCQRLGAPLHCNIAAAQRALCLSFIPLVSIFRRQSHGPVEICAGLFEIAAEHQQFAE